MRLPIRHVAGQLLFTTTGTVWSVWRVEPVTYAHASRKAKVALLDDTEALLKSRRARPGMVEETRKGAKAPSRGFDDVAPADVEEDVDLVPDAEDDDDGAGLIEDPGELGEDTIEEVEVEVGEDEE